MASLNMDLKKENPSVPEDASPISTRHSHV
jgi:hypothetical protein